MEMEADACTPSLCPADIVFPLHTGMNSLIECLLEIFFPSRCSLCGNNAPKIICKDCLNSFELISLPCCLKCSLPMQEGTTAENCDRCQGTDLSFDKIRAAFTYSGAVKQAIREYKYGKKLSIATLLARPLADIVEQENREAAFDYLVPVPLYKEKMRSRGFNQAQLIAEKVMARSGIPMLKLQRVRDTMPMTGLNVRERFKNLEGAFALDSPGKVRESSIAVIDDVVTTCSTINEIAKILKNSGARYVAGFAIARTPLQRGEQE
jgi:ComF family protein